METDSYRETSNMLTSLCLLCLCVLAVRADLSYGYSSPYDYSNYSAYSLTPAAASRTRRVFGAFSSDNPFSEFGILNHLMSEGRNMLLTPALSCYKDTAQPNPF